MEFFNKKEEVLELILTQKGKELYASGSFKPFFYSFHDSDIIYDDGSSEEQNSIVERIKNTARVHHNLNILENYCLKNTNLENNYMYCELGNKSLENQHKPAWRIEFIKSPKFQYVGSKNNPTVTRDYLLKLTASSGIYNSFDSWNANQEYIPQIDIQTNYKIVISGTGSAADYYLVKDDPILFNIFEENVLNVNDKQEMILEAYYMDNGDNTQLVFDKNAQNSIYKYLNILFDKDIFYENQNLIKNIYGNLVDKDETTC